uniref:Uncharacterized protein n=1 Tax=Anopheles dirus TaxID=7168 RepID=A0A182NYQ0_9DIPT
MAIVGVRAGFNLSNGGAHLPFRS